MFPEAWRECVWLCVCVYVCMCAKWYNWSLCLVYGTYIMTLTHRVIKESKMGCEFKVKTRRGGRKRVCVCSVCVSIFVLRVMEHRCPPEGREERGKRDGKTPNTTKLLLRSCSLRKKQIWQRFCHFMVNPEHCCVINTHSYKLCGHHSIITKELLIRNTILTSDSLEICIFRLIWYSKEAPASTLAYKVKVADEWISAWYFKIWLKCFTL